MMMGYAANSKAYKLWDTAKHKMVISRDVVFDELDDSHNSVDCPHTVPIEITDLVGEGECGADVEGDMDSALHQTDHTDAQIDATSLPHHRALTKGGEKTWLSF